MVVRKSFLVAVCAMCVLSVSSCSSDSLSTTIGTTPSVSVPIPTPEQQTAIDLVVKGWDVCLKKVGANLQSAQVSTEGAQKIVSFSGKVPIRLAITDEAGAQPVVKAADAATQAEFDKAGTDCQYR